SAVQALQARAAALEHEVERLRSIVRQARAIIVTTDLEGRVTSFNEEAEALLGYPAAEVLGRSADMFYAQRRTRERLLDRLEREGAVEEDVQVRAKDGKRRWLGLSLAWLRDERGERI